MTVVKVITCCPGRAWKSLMAGTVAPRPTQKLVAVFFDHAEQ